MRAFLALFIIGLFLGLAEILPAETLSDAQVVQLKKAGFSDSEIQKYIESGVRPKIRKLWEEGLREERAKTLSRNENRLLTAVCGVNSYTGKEYYMHFGNGRAWSIFSDKEKQGYVMGTWDIGKAHISALASIIDTRQVHSRCVELYDSFVAHGFTTSETAKMVDDIYQDTSNIRIPIIYVVKVAALKAGGASSEEIEKVLSDYRKKAAK